ncbi:MAG: ATP phosphoribosyltransferase [Candidatus Krumholzibacteriia bacterium]
MPAPPRSLRLALPKGRMQDGVFQLLAEAGLPVRASARAYRPRLDLPALDVKILKPQNTIEMLQAGTRDLGFAGADWVDEMHADVDELLDTGLDPVRLVAAAPAGLDPARLARERPLVVASEYERITRRWLEARGWRHRFVRSYGATEVFPPEDADLIVDNTATGATLAANGLVIVDTLRTSSTRLYASPTLRREPDLQERAGEFRMLAASVLAARERVMLEVNVVAARLDEVVAMLPCMREPTVSPLHGNGAYAVKAAVPRRELAALIPRLRACGGTDLVVTTPSQIVS